MDNSNPLAFSIVGSYRRRRDGVNHSFASAEGRSGQGTDRKKYTPDIIDITVRFWDWIIKNFALFVRNGTENL